jgi:sterol 3beta-glucosyltransferase
MRISIFVYGTWGDLRSHVVLGKALRAAGHEVQVVASKTYEAWVRARNLDFYPLRDDVGKLVNELSSTEVFNPLQQIRIVREVLPPVITRMGEDVLEATRDSDVLITVEFGLSPLLGVVDANHLRTILVNPAPLNPTRGYPSPAASPMPRWFPFQSLYNRFSYALVQRAQWSLLGKPRNDLRKKHPELPEKGFRDFRAALTATPTLTIVSPQLAQHPADWPEHWQVTGYLFDDDT